MTCLKSSKSRISSAPLAESSPVVIKSDTSSSKLLRLYTLVRGSLLAAVSAASSLLFQHQYFSDTQEHTYFCIMIMKYVDHQLHPAETLFHIVAEAQFNRIGSTFIHFLHIGKIHIRFIKLPILTKDLITSHLLLNNAFKILFLILALDECPQPCCLHNMAAFHIYLCMGPQFSERRAS